MLKGASMQKLRVIATLPVPDYRALEQQAKQDVRTVEQQASFLLRRVLAEQDRQAVEVAS
jgi:hypothetical protein